MSASTTPTRRPCPAIDSARLTVTEDLPTPPLPDAIAKTFVREPGCEKGISRCALPPLSTSLSPDRCSAVITPSVRSTSVTPSTARRAPLTSRVMVSLSGQPATVRSTVSRTSPESSTSTDSTMPRSVIGRLISGSWTVARAAVSRSAVGRLMMLPG